MSAIVTDRWGSHSRNDEIAATLRDEILSGQYRPGERLPSERDLALRFATGRGSVREALKRLEQLGIVTIQRGGARIVPVESCTLDVLGPLLELDEVPNIELTDQVLQMIGALIRLAAREAFEKATPEQIAHIKQLAASLLADAPNPANRHEALRALAEYLVEVSDHLVLRLIMNGMRTSFFVRMQQLGIQYDLDSEGFSNIALEIQSALDKQNYERVGVALERLNRFFRDGVRAALEKRQTARNSA
jgi:DNA-binding FadR family transcriptional regulator